MQILSPIDRPSTCGARTTAFTALGVLYMIAKKGSEQTADHPYPMSPWASQRFFSEVFSHTTFHAYLVDHTFDWVLLAQICVVGG